jgi:type IV pilus assembly protein PilA
MDYIMFAPINRALDARLKGIKDEEKGFTLIELLVVVIIIGILAAIAIPVYLGIQNNAKDSAVKSDVANLKTAIVGYMTANNSTTPTSGTTDLSSFGFTTPAATGNYASPGAIPVYSFNTAGTAFCVIATSVTGTKVGASDSTGVRSGVTSCAAGVLT